MQGKSLQEVRPGGLVRGRLDAKFQACHDVYLLMYDITGYFMYLMVWTLEYKEIFIFGVAWIVQIVDHINRSVGETAAIAITNM